MPTQKPTKTGVSRKRPVRRVAGSAVKPERDPAVVPEKKTVTSVRRRTVRRVSLPEVPNLAPAPAKKAPKRAVRQTALPEASVSLSAGTKAPAELSVRRSVPSVTAPAASPQPASVSTPASNPSPRPSAFSLPAAPAAPTPQTGDEIIRATDVFKAFDIGTQMVLVLKGVTFSVTLGDFMVLFGASGCGKSTLLHILLGLEPPTKGTITFLDEDMYAGRSEDDRAQFRKYHIGMVYQQSNWVKSLTVLENVAFPMMLLGEDKTKSLEKAYDTLKVMKMENWAHYHPMELSGGQQQRVAVARAIITDPEVLVADEPTGNLDYEAGQNLMYLLNDLNHMGKTIIMVTHDLEYIQYSKTALNMKDGRIEGIYRDKEKTTLESKLTYKKADFSSLEKK